MAIRRDVTVGDQVGDRVVVRSGLVEGEQVIVSAIASLSDQSPVVATVVDASR
jgi:multidrug efflux pump subunit AcrA (membrane-fusion protein)